MAEPRGVRRLAGRAAVLDMGGLGQPEIEDLGLDTRGHEDVGRLDVAVDDAVGVGGVQRVRNLSREVQHQTKRERPAVHVLLERLALEQLHGDELRALELVDLVDRADVRVIERRGGARLAQKPIGGLLIADAIGRQKLERHEARELDVLGLVDDAHAARADGLEHPVVRDGLANHWGRKREA